MKPSKKEIQESKLHKIPLRITDTTLRDAHQSVWAARMRLDDILPIAETIDSVGYYSIECWGGATFDACLQFLRENPWERLRTIKAKIRNTPLQMLLRGQNLVGYHNYANDVVDRFVALACENGMDIFRIFDALNDTRNLEAAVKAVKKYGGHVQGTISYTISPVHTIERFVQYAREQEQLGVDSLCIKDTAGILSPIMSERLVSALIKAVDIPIQLHCHASSGMAVAAYVEGVRAGAGAIDCTVSSMSGTSSQPPVETLAYIFSETNYAADLDMDAIERVAQYFEKLSSKRRRGFASRSPIDPAILRHQIPGGMISNFCSQLEKQGALDKLPLVLDEVVRVREDLGWPPLLTPTSQIVGTQAFLNIITGERYKVVTTEVKDYLRGLYGQPPGPIDKKFRKKILGDEEPIVGRPADALSPMLPHATDGLDHKLIEHEEDIISYIILPKPSLEYFKWRATQPQDRPPIPADLEETEADKRPLPGQPDTPLPPQQSVQPTETFAVTASAGAAPHLFSPDEYKSIGEMLSHLKGVPFSEVTLRKGDMVLTVRGYGNGATAPQQTLSSVAPPTAAENAPLPAATTTTAAPHPANSESVALSPEKTPPLPYSATINSPLVGTFYTSSAPGKPGFVSEGDIVDKGTKVCMVEAMKLFNEIEAPCNCRIVKVLVKNGETVQKDQPLIGIEPIS